VFIEPLLRNALGVHVTITIIIIIIIIIIIKIIKSIALSYFPSTTAEKIPAFVITLQPAGNTVKIDKLSLCSIKQAQGHEDVWGTGSGDPPFLTLELDGGEWSVSRPGGKRPRYPLYRELGGSRKQSRRCLSGW
jgi:hypothetical protein